MIVLRRFLLVAALALVTAAQAQAHAIPLHTEPPPGSTLLTAPTAVYVTFDSPVQVGSRNAAVRNDGTNVLAGKPHVDENGKRLVMPLETGLSSGLYSVRWSIVSDDGHEEESVLSFGIGTSDIPVSVLTTHGSVTWQRVIMRAIFLLGVLGAAGAAFFALALLGGALPRRMAHLLFAFFLLAFVGADALIHVSNASGTRFERFMIVAAIAAGIGGVAAALAPLEQRLRHLIWPAAGVLFLCPTLAGHSLDADQPAVIAPAADLLHLGGAAVWVGGVASLAFARIGTVKRFSQYAMPAVAVVALGGAARALTELSSVSQVWTTSYGRTLIVKTAIFGVLLGLVWLARRRMLVVQFVLLIALATTVGTLTDLRPGRARATATETTQSNIIPPPAGPASGAFVDGKQAGKLAIGFAWLNGRATVTVVGPDGGGDSDADITIDGNTAEECGDGCYTGPAFRSATVGVNGMTLHFDVPAKIVSAAAALARATRLYETAPAITFRERLSSQPGTVVVSLFHERSPDRVAYSIISSTTASIRGNQVIVIGEHRWTRTGNGPWRETAQGVLRVPNAYWSPQAHNAFFSGIDELTFYDPQTHAWFRLRVDQAGRPAELTMIAGAHFMHHDYSFQSPEISPPR